jgi:hypothetical protein
MFLAAKGGGRKGDLSRFIEAAVREHLFPSAVNQAKAVSGTMSESQVNELINEAVQWARDHKRPLHDSALRPLAGGPAQSAEGEGSKPT